jgi:hypothetical protein
MKKKQIISLKPKDFKFLKSALGKSLKKKCDFCGRRITSKNYGFLAVNTVSCKDLICLTRAIMKEENSNAKGNK